jgi:virginiamycin B lyase
VAIGFASLWIANRTEGTVSRLDARTGRVLATIPIGDTARLHPGCEVDYDDSPAGTFLIRRCDLPSAIAVGAGAVWVGRNDTLSIVKIDPGTNRVVATIPVGVHVFGLTASNSAVWVSAYEDERVVRIDPSTNGINLDLPVAHGPSGIASDGASVWTTDYRGSSVSGIDGAGDHVRWTIPVGWQPFPIVISDGSAWVRNEGDATLSRIEIATGKLIATIPIDAFTGTDGIDSLAATGAGIWLGGQRLQRVDPSSNRVVESLPFEGRPLAAGDETLWIIGISGLILHIDPRC